MKLNADVVYLLFQQRLAEHVGKDNIMSARDAAWLIGRCHNISKAFRYSILHEMKNKQLLEFVNEDTIRLINTRWIKVLESPAMINHSIGVW